MTDLNVVMREQAIAGLNSQLDAAVTNGDAEAARKITKQLTDIAVQTAPKAPPFGANDIYAELAKVEWYGIDPKKSAMAETFGKTMDVKKFATAAAFAAALVKAVDDEFKPPVKEGEEEDEDDGAPEGETAEQKTERLKAKEKPAARRATDAPGEGDTLGTRPGTRSTGPWAKVGDAPRDVQAEIKRAADKFVPKSATKEQRETYIAKSLESHYAAFQRNKGKK
jgi:hypothetical protein